MKTNKITYDKNGLGFMEMTALGLYHPMMFALVMFLINKNMGQIALKVARIIISHQ